MSQSKRTVGLTLAVAAICALSLSLPQSPTIEQPVKGPAAAKLK